MHHRLHRFEQFIINQTTDTEKIILLICVICGENLKTNLTKLFYYGQQKDIWGIVIQTLITILTAIGTSFGYVDDAATDEAVLL